MSANATEITSVFREKIALATQLNAIFADVELTTGDIDPIKVSPQSARWHLLHAARHLAWSLDVNRLATIRKRMCWIVEAASYLAHHTRTQIEAGGLQILTSLEFNQVASVQNALALAQSYLAEDISDLVLTKSRKLV